MAKQGREVPRKWDWTEASVWTERRLETLERGIKGGKWTNAYFADLGLFSLVLSGINNVTYLCCVCERKRQIERMFDCIRHAKT